MENDKKLPCTVLAILYVLLSYASPLIWLGLAGEDAPSIIFLVLLSPFVLGIINAIYLRIFFQKINRMTLLRSAIIIKYSLIPLYLAGGLMIVLFLMLTFTPVVIMIFVGPLMIAGLSVYGYLMLLGGNAFSLAYIRKAKEEGVQGVLLSTIGKILQFLFFADVVSLAILSLKEKKYVGVTVAVFALLVLVFWGISAWMIVNIVATCS